MAGKRSTRSSSTRSTRSRVAPTAAVNEYLIGVTLRVRGRSQTDAKERASAALLTLAGDEIRAAWIDKDARLFDPGAFAQIKGQLSIDDGQNGEDS